MRIRKSDTLLPGWRTILANIGATRPLSWVPRARMNRAIAKYLRTRKPDGLHPDFLDYYAIPLLSAMRSQRATRSLYRRQVTPARGMKYYRGTTRWTPMPAAFGAMLRRGFELDTHPGPNESLTRFFARQGFPEAGQPCL